MLEDVTKAVPPMFRKIVKSQAPEDTDLSVRLFDLERRFAAMSPIRQSIVSDENIPREDSVDWAQVQHYLMTRKQPPLPPRFDSRAEAVAWAIAQSRRMPASVLRRHLAKRLGPRESERIFESVRRAPFQISGSGTRLRMHRISDKGLIWAA
jgi:hypothetical protein